MTSMKLQRNTRQRQVILEELRKLTSHPTAADLYEIVRRRLPKISLGTVYRNLELLTQTDLIQKLEISGTEARFDGNADQHDHIRCVRCGRVGDLHSVPGDRVRDGIKELDGYEILGYHLWFFGICPACRKQPASKDSPSRDR